MKIKYKVKIFILKLKILSAGLISKRNAALKSYQIFCTPYFSAPYDISLFTTPPIIENIHFDNKTIKTYNWNMDAKKKILIAHGFNSAAYKFDHLVQKYIQLGYGITALDAPAHGNSDGKILEAQDYKEVLHIIENQLGNFDFYLGHSMGGLALSIYLKSYQIKNKKLVLIAPAVNTRQIISNFFKTLKLGDAMKQNFFDWVETQNGSGIDSFHLKNHLPNEYNSILWIHDYNDRITPIDDVIELKKTTPRNIEFYFTHHLGHNKIYRTESVVEKIISYTN